MHDLLSIITFLPALAALVLLVVLRGGTPEAARNARWLALAATVLTFLVSLKLLWNFDPSNTGFQFVEDRPWILGMHYKMGVDGLSVLFVMLTTALMPLTIGACWSVEVRVKEYMISFLILEVGMTGVFVALDMFLFYVFWEVVLVPMYLIIGIWGGPNRIYATIKFVLYTLVGSLLMLVAILATAFAFQADHGGSWVGAFDFETLRTFASTGGFSTHDASIAALGGWPVQAVLLLIALAGAMAGTGFGVNIEAYVPCYRSEAGTGGNAWGEIDSHRPRYRLWL